MKYILSVVLDLALLVLPVSSAFATAGDVWIESSTPGTHTTDANLSYTGAGNLNVKGITSGTNPLTLTNNTNATTGGDAVGLFRLKSSGTVNATGFGPYNRYQVEGSGLSATELARVGVETAGATNTGEFYIQTMIGGSLADRFVIGNDGAVNITNRLSFDDGAAQGDHSLIEAIINASGTTQYHANWGITGRVPWQGQISGIALDVQNTMTADVTGDWPGGGYPYHINSVLTMQNKAGSTGSTGALMGMLIMDRTAAGDYTEHAGIAALVTQNSPSTVNALLFALNAVAEKKNSGSVWGQIIELRNTYGNDAGMVGLKIQSCCTGQTEYSVGPAISLSHSQSGNGFGRILEYQDHNAADVFVIGSAGEILAPIYAGTGNKPVCADSSGQFYRATGSTC